MVQSAAKSNELLALLAFGLASGCHHPVSSTFDAGSEVGYEAANCGQNNGGCDPNAACVERGGSRVCICKPWSFGDGLNCTKTGLQVESPWPVAGANVRHTSQSAYVGPQTNRLKWPPIKTEGYGGNSPIIDADGTVYMVAKYNLHAFNPDGTLKWTFAPDKAPFRWSTPALGANGLLYVQADNGIFYALETTASPVQRVRWSYSTKDAFENAPIIGADGTVYAASEFSGTHDGQFYAFDPDGATLAGAAPGPKAIFPSGGSSYSSPALGRDGTLFLPSDAGKLYAIGPDCSQKWSILLMNEIAGPPPVVGADGTVFLGTRTGSLYAVSPETGAAQSIKIADRINSLAMGADGVLYVGTHDKRVLAVAYSAGWRSDWQRWSFAAQSGVGDIALGADGTIYACAEILYAIKPDGTLKWKAEAVTEPFGPVIAADGTLYVGGGDGILYALGQ
jgi:outer membrane protein assembly factor BamB